MEKTMKKVGLISCSKKKQDKGGPAHRLYSASTLFSKAYAYAQANYDVIYILSAKHGLIIPEMWIEPYDQMLAKMKSDDRVKWGREIVRVLNLRYSRDEVEFYFHAGMLYRKLVMNKLSFHGYRCFVPLEGLMIGQQLAWYTNRLKGLRQTTF